MLLDRFSLRAVVQLPPGVLAPLSSIPLMVVLLERDFRETPTVSCDLDEIGQVRNVYEQPWMITLLDYLNGGDAKQLTTSKVRDAKNWSVAAFKPRRPTLADALKENQLFRLEKV